MKTYKIVNNVLGWIIFLIAAYTYCSTIEPTASFWDCPEFITTASKFEVGHPPGAPFFMLLGKLFSLFASDTSQIAMMINTMSALLSAGCILFLFWSVTHLAKALIATDRNNVTMPQTIAIMASGVAGALIYTWSDTFWFSAVEGEVYAFSSFMTAIVFWLILKWEDQADQPHSDRWIVLIAYLAGMSIGVHLLNLLCIPAIVLVYYFRKTEKPNLKGSILALVVSAVIIVAILYGIIPGVVKMAAWFDYFFVNTLHCSFNTGFYIYLSLLAVVLGWGLFETYKGTNIFRMKISFILSVLFLGIPFVCGTQLNAFIIGAVILALIAFFLFRKKDVSVRLLNTALLCMTMIVVGYSSYAITVVRSVANPPMDQNSPEDAFALQEYLNREQYGDRPLLFGPAYTSKPEIVSDGQYYKYNTKNTGAVYQRKEKVQESDPDEYVKIRDKFDYVYPSNQVMFFPRIYDADHAQAYEQWLGGVRGKQVSYTKPDETVSVKMPTQLDNLKFFITYQCNFMYWRYFMWNFAGRQNDIQGNGELEHGNWLSGIPFIDNMRLGDQSKLPSDLLENKGRNLFYCLPLILGLFGFFWQAFKGEKGIQQFWVVFFLFFMTGLAIVLYLNQVPQQPRERDYAYAGSFYAFSMWCGLGIAAIYDWLSGFLMKNGKSSTALAASIISVVPAIAVPLQMVSQTWDDHDRSGRYMCRDFGLNYLQTIPHDGIIYTNGDNDTFPLWYNEDTEGNRTDVRVCNLSYLQTDWYIDQMKRPAFEGEGMSSPLPITWKRLDYVSGRNEIVEVNPTVSAKGMKYKDFVLQLFRESPEEAKRFFGEDPFELKNIINNLILNKEIDDAFRQIPTDTVFVTVDKEAVRKSGMLIPGDSIPDKMVIDLSGMGRLTKSQLMVLEMIAESNFTRPIYMSTTVGSSNYGKLYKNFIQEGLAYRITPFSFEQNSPSSTIVDTEKMFDNMVNKYKYGNLSQKGLYIDETTMRMCLTHRRWFSLLINSLVDKGDIAKAKIALEKCTTEIPDYNVPHNLGGGSLDLAKAYFMCGMPEKGEQIFNALMKSSKEYLEWYMSLSTKRFASAQNDAMNQLYVYNSIIQFYNSFSEEKEGVALPKVLKDKAGEYAKKAEDLQNTLSIYYNNYMQRINEIPAVNY